MDQFNFIGPHVDNRYLLRQDKIRITTWQSLVKLLSGSMNSDKTKPIDFQYNKKLDKLE